MCQAWKQDGIVSDGLKVVHVFHVCSNNEHDGDERRQEEGDQREWGWVSCGLISALADLE